MKVSLHNYGQYSSNNYGSSRMVTIGTLDLYFSYNTVIAFNDPKTGLIVRENDWGPTTGRHLNWIEPDKKKRIPRDQFEKILNVVLHRHGLD